MSEELIEGALNNGIDQPQMEAEKKINTGFVSLRVNVSASFDDSSDHEKQDIAVIEIDSGGSAWWGLNVEFDSHRETTKQAVGFDRLVLAIKGGHERRAMIKALSFAIRELKSFQGDE